jgi:hypothetical protein
MSRVLSAFALLVAALVAPAAYAYELAAARVSTSLGTLEQVHVTHEAGEGAWSLAIAHAKAPDLALAATNLRVRLECGAAAPLRCVGPWSIAKPAVRGRGEIAIDADSSWRVRADSGRHRFALIDDLAPEGVRADLVLPLDLLDARVRAAWAGYAGGRGDLSADLRVARDGERIHGRWRLAKAAFDSSDGTIAGAGLSVAGSVDYSSSSGRERAQLELGGFAGELLLGPLYFELPPAPAAVGLDLRGDAAAWRTLAASLRDGTRLQAEVAVALAPDSDWRRVELTGIDLDLGDFSKRYLGAPLAASGFADARFEGRVRGRGGFTPDGWQQLVLQVQKANLQDGAGRASLSGVEAELQLGAGGPLSRLRFDAAQLFGIAVAGNELRWRWSPRELRLDAPVRFALLGGEVELKHLLRRDPDGSGAISEAALELRRLDLAALCRALGLPEFGGSIGGDLPVLRYQDGILRSGGDLELAAFDGRIRVHDLSIERLFGVAPSLAADLELRAIDLKTFTQALSFGEIEGRMNADITGLRLVDWAPIAFDARFRTDDAWRGRKRLSQRAVQGLSSVGGGSTGTGGLVRLVDSFGYDAIALSCRLEQNVCTMGGLESAHGGYTIVRGSGLPRINVVGHQQRVDWPMLVRRLQAAAAGAAPIID